MNDTKTGGPAFPVPYPGKEGKGWVHGFPGMTLRDYFAENCANGILSCPDTISDFIDSTGLNGNQAVARVSYQIADHILAERERSKA